MKVEVIKKGSNMLSGNKASKIVRQPKILIVDEINYTRLGFDYALTGAGYKITTARNNEEAMASITSELPDVILLSLRPNDSNGIQILKELKEYFRLRLDIAQGAEPPVIILSAYRNTRQARDLQYLGASTVLFKPINIQELPDIITSVITNKHKSIPQERKRILIFDGESRSHKFIESVLAHETYDFETSESEAETLAKIKNRQFDLAILDISSFESDFSNALNQIKEMASGISIITVSAFGGHVSKEEFAQLGIEAHFTKPINVDELQKAVDKIMESKSARIEAKEEENKEVNEQDETKVDELINNLTDQVEENE